MSKCPICQSPVNEKANFCSECGNQLSTATFERAWIAAMQAKIKNIRQNDITYNLASAVGIIIAMAVPFLMRYVLHFTMDFLSWLFTAAGVLIFAVGYLGLWFDSQKVKKLIEELEKGRKD